MKPQQLFILIFLLLTNLLSAGERPARFEQPEAVVAWLYRDFGWECFLPDEFNDDLLIDQPLAVLERYFVSDLAAFIVQDRAWVAQNNEVGSIDFVLLFGSQDPDGISNLRIKPDNGQVQVLYDQNGQDDVMEIRFVTRQTKQGWRIFDIHYHSQMESVSEIDFSLREILAPQKK